MPIEQMGEDYLVIMSTITVTPVIRKVPNAQAY